MNRFRETLLLSQKIGAEKAFFGDEKEKVEEQVEEADGEEHSSEAERLRLRTMMNELLRFVKY